MVVEIDDEVEEVLATLAAVVVKPSKAFAQTIVPLPSAV